jgi:hypothetical protein
MTFNNDRFTGEPSQDLPPDFLEAVRQINASWQKQTKSILETAQLVKEARDKFTGRTHVLIKRLAFEPALFKKLCKIGGDARLYNERNIEKLPGGYSLLWELTKLDDAGFTAAIDSGAIHPHVKRTDIVKLVKPTEPTRPKRPPNSRLSIHVNWSIPEYRKSEFQEWLRHGQDRFKGIMVNWPDDDADIEPRVPPSINSPTTQPSNSNESVEDEIDEALAELGVGRKSPWLTERASD